MEIKSQKLETGSIFNTKKFKVFFGNKQFTPREAFNKNIIFGKQTHDAELINTNNIISPYCKSILSSSDGLYTNKKEVGLGIYTADCMPCFIITPKTIFSLHLGWKSLYKGLLAKALQKISPDDLKKTFAFIGPHIQQNSFEVKSDFISQVSKIFPKNEWLTEKNNRFYASLSSLALNQLKNLNPQYIFISSVDTKTSADHHSYRRTPLLPHRNLSFAFLKKDSVESDCDHSKNL